MHIRFVKDHRPSGHRSGDEIDCDRSFGHALIGAGIAQEIVSSAEPAYEEVVSDGDDVDDDL